MNSEMETASALQSSADTNVTLLYDTYHSQVLGYLFRLVRDREIAEDLCQDTFLKAWSGWERHNPEASAAGWLYRIATNTAYDHARRARRILFLPFIDEAAEAVGDTRMDTNLDTRATVHQALEHLSELDRLSLVLSAHAGYSAHEIGNFLGCSDAAVRTRLHRARVRFQQLYGAAQLGAFD